MLNHISFTKLFSDMAQLMNVRLSRVDAQPWGLRLQGGKDFGTPLVVQKVCTSPMQVDFITFDSFQVAYALNATL